MLIYACTCILDRLHCESERKGYTDRPTIPVLFQGIKEPRSCNRVPRFSPTLARLRRRKKGSSSDSLKANEQSEPIRTPPGYASTYIRTRRKWATNKMGDQSSAEEENEKRYVYVCMCVGV